MQEAVTIDAIMERLRAFIRQQFEIPANDREFTDDVHLFDYGYIDSFGAVELTTFVESAFEIKVTPADLVACPLNSIREIASFVQKRRTGEA
jgi:D-alanine--poly(phosphoribitol) ligase subunit 2